jgi:hypothetical protein
MRRSKMFIVEQKYSPERRRTRLVELRLVLLLICLTAFHPGMNDNEMNLTQVSFADIVPSQPGPDVTIAGPSPRSRLGGSGQPDNLSDSNHSQTIAVGDLNADGIQDLAISAPDAELIVGSTIRRAGAVYLIFGRRNLPSLIDTAKAQPGGAEVAILGVSDGDRFGFALAAGDVNGDSVPDLLAGAPGAHNAGRANAGAVFVFFGSHSFGAAALVDLTQGNSADLTIYGPGDRFGASLSAGDAGGRAVTGPVADVLIGAPGSGIDSGGAAYLIYGAAGMGSSTRVIDVAIGGADFALRGDIRQHLGSSVAIGDFNGDGDIFAGAPGASRPDRSDLTVTGITPAASTGAVFGVFGPFPQGGQMSTDVAGQVISFYGTGTGHLFGTTLAVGDLTGDSVADVAIGAPNLLGDWTDPATGSVYHLGAFSGGVFVFAGGTTLTQRRFDVAASEQLTTYVGGGHSWSGFNLALGSYNVTGNADLTADLAIGSPGGVRDASRNVGGIGGVNVIFGGRTLGAAKTRPRFPFNPAPEPEDVQIFNPDQSRSADFGFAVAAGDINGDGSGDLVVAAPFMEAAGRAQAGQVQIRFGTTKPGGGGGGDPMAPPTVRIVTPVGGEQLTGGRLAVITWSATPIEKVRSFDLLLSTDGGLSFPTGIVSGLPASQTSMSWVVPGICASSARIQVVATTSAGEKVIAVSDGNFAIAQAGTGLDLGRSSIADGGLLLVAASGEVFPGGAIVEISTDQSGGTFQVFSRTPKIKGGGRKLKTRGTINGQSLTDYFPEGATRALRLIAPHVASRWSW